MKFHETSFDDYINENKKKEFHPELLEFHSKIPKNNCNMGNILLYGPSGIGKYTQALKIITKYSPSDLKYEKKMSLNSEKYNYMYKISDIHYEIDFALLGCNAKLVWHEIFLQIVDIISMSSAKYGIILCKNFHTIHPELLPIFYSYMHQYNNITLPFQIKYIIITEQISFISNNILNYIKVVNIKQPAKDIYYDYLKLPDYIDNTCLMNLKEINMLNSIQEDQEIPIETFDVICESIKEKMDNPKKLELLEFRELIYDVLVYNLDFIEVVWDIISHYVQEGKLKEDNLKITIKNIHRQLKQYNNNYRPIYHLENILLNIINSIKNE
jgi:hypothetical protein